MQNGGHLGGHQGGHQGSAMPWVPLPCLVADRRGTAAVGSAMHRVGGRAAQVPPPVICMLRLLLDGRNVSLCPGRQDWVEADRPAGPAVGRELTGGRSKAGGTAGFNTFGLGKMSQNLSCCRG